jgi:hypothetical protein
MLKFSFDNMCYGAVQGRQSQLWEFFTPWRNFFTIFSTTPLNRVRPVVCVEISNRNFLKTSHQPTLKCFFCLRWKNVDIGHFTEGRHYREVVCLTNVTTIVTFGRRLKYSNWKIENFRKISKREIFQFENFPYENILVHKKLGRFLTP